MPGLGRFPSPARRGSGSVRPPGGQIIVLDNAAGIALADFPRAFRPADIPPDRSGLCEFGMGMKSAAFWYASKWSVRTSALGESVERQVNLDINSSTATSSRSTYPAIVGMAGSELLLGLFPVHFILAFRSPFLFPYQICANFNFLL